MQDNSFHLIRCIAGDYREVWTGTAEKYCFSSTEPWQKIVGSINIDMVDDELVYSQLIRSYDTPNLTENSPFEVESRMTVLKFDEVARQYVLIRNEAPSISLKGSCY